MSPEGAKKKQYMLVLLLVGGCHSTLGMVSNNKQKRWARLRN
jgi:hypothetical protein